MVVLRHEAPVDTRHSLIAYSIQQGLDVLVEDFAFEGKVKARHFHPLVRVCPDPEDAQDMRGHGHHKWKGMAQRDVWDARIRLRSDQIVVFWLERWWHMVMDTFLEAAKADPRDGAAFGVTFEQGTGYIFVKTPAPHARTATSRVAGR